MMYIIIHYTPCTTSYTNPYTTLYKLLPMLFPILVPMKFLILLRTPDVLFIP